MKTLAILMVFAAAVPAQTWFGGGLGGPNVSGGPGFLVPGFAGPGFGGFGGRGVFGPGLGAGFGPGFGRGFGPGFGPGFGRGLGGFVGRGFGLPLGGGLTLGNRNGFINIGGFGFGAPYQGFGSGFGSGFGTGFGALNGFGNFGGFGGGIFLNGPIQQTPAREPLAPIIATRPELPTLPATSRAEIAPDAQADYDDAMERYINASASAATAEAIADTMQRSLAQQGLAIRNDVLTQATRMKLRLAEAKRLIEEKNFALAKERLAVVEAEARRILNQFGG
jgi:hypothetical protein